MLHHIIENIDNIKWIDASLNGGNGKVPTNKICVSYLQTPDFREKNPGSELANSLVIRIGMDIANLMGWKANEYAYAEFYPDDLLTLRLQAAPKESKAKFKMIAQSRNALTIRVPWRFNDKTPLKSSNFFEAEHHIYRSKQIILVARKVVMAGEAQHEPDLAN